MSTADIPDIGDSGLAQAYTAWKSVTKSSNTKELRLPGLDYTPEQLFFLSFARIWAQLTRPATAVSRIRTDPHSPPYWRATGTLRNLDVFHKAFGCKAGSRVSQDKLSGLVADVIDEPSQGGSVRVVVGSKRSVFVKP
jgi:endothelin-converting enzyme